METLQKRKMVFCGDQNDAGQPVGTCEERVTGFGDLPSVKSKVKKKLFKFDGPKD